MFRIIEFVWRQVCSLLALSVSCCWSAEINLKSSAKPYDALLSINSGRSLTKIIKNRGPRMDPWGTPLVAFFAVESLFPILTL